jgi:hypothetical protein
VPIGLWNNPYLASKARSPVVQNALNYSTIITINPTKNMKNNGM